MYEKTTPKVYKEDGYVSLEIAERFIYISSILIKKEDRNKGLGSKLLKQIINNAREEGKECIYLLASKELGGDLDRLILWYKRFGFEEVDDKDDIAFNYNMKLIL